MSRVQRNLILKTQKELLINPHDQFKENSTQKKALNNELTGEKSTMSAQEWASLEKKFKNSKQTKDKTATSKLETTQIEY